MKYYTVRGWKDKKIVFQSIAMSKFKAKALKRDIVENRKKGSWSEGIRFTVGMI